MPESNELLTATTAYSLTNARLASAKRTLETIRSRPGIAAETVDLVVEFERRADGVKEQANGVWRAFDDRTRDASERANGADPQEKAKAKAEIPLFQAQAAEARAELNPALTDIAEESRLLVEEIRGLHALVSGNPIEEKVRERFVVNRTELEKGRKHHQDQSYLMLFALLALVLSGIVFAFLFFKEDVPGGPPEVLVLHATLRVSVLFAIGWLAAFVGRQYSRHSEQSVSYTDRLAALDAIDLVLEFGAPASKEESLRLLIQAYLSERSNAFRPGEPDPKAPAEVVLDAVKTIDPLLTRTAKVLKSLPGTK